MTRGTLAYITYDNSSKDFIIHSSVEFNGDMGHEMSKGKKTIRRLMEVKTIEDFNKTIEETMQDFKYITCKNSSYIGLTDEYPAKKAGTSKEKSYEVTSEILATVFNYSDYEYVMNFSDKSFWFWDNDDNIAIEFKPNAQEIYVLYFGNFIGKIVKDRNLFFVKEGVF